MEAVDVVVIGSGYGGSVPAARLAQGGMDVVVLERGPRWGTTDLKQSDDPRNIQRIVELVVGSTNVAFRTGKMVGGASVPMDGAHFRVPTKSFEARDPDGRRFWPSACDRSTMDPFYEAAEQMLHIRQVAWSEVSRAGGLFTKMIDRVGGTVERARMNYADCLHCGFCATGCIYEKKWTMLQTYIPAAEAAGAEFRPGCGADHVEPDGTGWIVTYTQDGVPKEIRGQRVIVAGGGIHSPTFLLRSAPYIPGLSAQTGENFNNNGEHAFLGILPPDFDDLSRYATYKGSDNAMVMCFHWFEDEGFSLHPGGGFEPSVYAAGLAAPDHAVLPARPWGMDYKRFVEATYRNRLIGFSALGLAPGHRAITIKGDGTPDIVERDRTGTDAYLDRVEAVMADVSAQTGVTLIPSTSRKLAGTTSTHLLSACRMAESADDGVVDANNQVFGAENLYVCDASSIPYAIAVNPALTITALSERCAAHILEVG